jgi:hypothetical protein
MPTYIAQNDNFQTAIALDGTASADEVDDPTATRPLTYSWNVGGDFKIQDGDLGAAKVTILLKGDRPVPVTLSVTDADDHLTAKSTLMIGITLQP